MKLIAGLGNPERKYKNNRHNAGFMFLDYLTDNWNCASGTELTNEKKMLSKIAKIKCNNKEYILAKPQTYMNNSGIAIQKIAAYFKIKHHLNLFIAHDDLDIPLGKFRIQKKTGPKSHNGISSIEQMLGIQNFFRIRIGVDNRSQEEYRISGESYVLQDFKIQEKDILFNIFPDIFKQLKTYLKL